MKLRTFNLLALGLFFGYFMSQALLLSLGFLDGVVYVKEILSVVGVGMGVILTFQAADQWALSIPFVQLTAVKQRKKDLLVSVGALADGRMVDLAASGLLDHQLVIPSCVLKGLYDETGKKALENLKKLEQMPELGLRFNESELSKADPEAGVLRLAAITGSNLLTVAQKSEVVDDVKCISLHALSHALKPMMQCGEQMKIKIQRYGKEPHQGVGYLEDGSMVVVNGGGEYLGESIDVKVLSVKHTSSGRMIFCNVNDMEASYAGMGEED